jgi:RimJ/RimL family protein N-acetyltransferase
MQDNVENVIRSPLARIDGVDISLRLVQQEDASYIYNLRTNPAYSRYLSAVTGTVGDQRSWIKSYKTRESVGSEYYFIIERKDGLPCGVVRLYNITDTQFTWGSWILDNNKPHKASLESALLSFDFGFNSLGIQTANIDVQVENTHAQAFYRRLGMIEVRRTEREIYFIYSREQFTKDHQAHTDALLKNVNDYNKPKSHRSHTLN